MGLGFFHGNCLWLRSRGLRIPRWDGPRGLYGTSRSRVPSQLPRRGVLPRVELDQRYVEGLLERIGKDDPDGEGSIRGILEDGDDRDFVRRISGVGWRSGRADPYELE